MSVSCDPSTLLQAAECLDRCISPGLQQALKTYLACQWAQGHAVGGYESKLWAYFKAEDPNASAEAVDSVAGNNLPVSGGPSVTTAGFIGNAWQMQTFRWRRTVGQVYNFAGHDFTIRFWLKLDTGSYGTTLFDNNGFELLLNAGRTLTWVIFKNIGQVSATTGAIPDDGAWHRIICWNKTAVEVGIMIDQNTPVTTPITEAMFDSSPDFLEFNANSGLLHFQGIDEVGFWKDYIFTDADKVFDWNNGAGRTYPLP